jgi:hypothetical protein
MFAERSSQLQQRGMSRRSAMMLVATRTAVPLEGEWLEAFWCIECQQTKWYHVIKRDSRTYEISLAPRELWEQVTGVVYPQRNPTVGEFTHRQARFVGYKAMKDFQLEM